MVTLLLAIIYIAFISLGLPDALLGAAWPLMVEEYTVPLSYAGVISMIICGGTIVSSLCSDRMTRKLGAGLVTAISVGLTALSLLGFSLSHFFWVLCLLAVPYGLGAGAVDAALNNYVALHYSSRHMSWLHCFWGLGASVGPYIMGWALGVHHSWRMGYGAVSVIQIVLTAALFLTLPLWKRSAEKSGGEERAAVPLKLGEILHLRGVKPVLVAFFCYCAFETTAGLWASSYLVEHRAVEVETAASYAAMFYLGITVGRFFSGCISDRVGDKNMIRLGVAVMCVGLVLMALPLPNVLVAVVGLVVFGLGAAPVYPSVIHATPHHFGPENSQAIVGVQMAGAYCGSTFVPPLFGLVAQHIHMGLYPYFLAAFLLVLLVMTEQVNKMEKAK